MADDDKVRIDVTLSPLAAKQWNDMRQSIRDKGHSMPTPKTLLSALIDCEKRRGEPLEEELLVPFRLANPDAD